MQDQNKLKACIEACWDCRHECQETFFKHCLKEGGKHVEKEHVKIMMDCIQICQIAADFMVRESKHHTEICKVCARICLACADSCKQIGDEKMKQCADICLQCAQLCEAMSQ